MNRRDYLMFADFRATPQARIAGALAAFAARGETARVVLVAAGEGAAVPGVTVREAQAGEPVVRPGIVLVGGQK